MSTKAKNIIMMALAGILLIACKDKTYKPPTLDAMRSADKARAAWARETEEHPATVETPISRMDSTAKDSVSTLYGEESSNTSYQENDNKSSSMGENHQSSEETEEKTNMVLYVILFFVATCIGMAISVYAFGTGGKRKKIFQDIYFSVEDTDGIGVLYTKTGEYSAILKMENPVQKYSANIDSYYGFTNLFAAIAQTLGEGYALHKQDIFTRKQFKDESGKGHEFLSESYFRYFNGREYTDSMTYLTITQENNKSRLMAFDNKKWRDFLVKIRKVQDQLKDAGIKAVAIDSKTPVAERQADIEAFKKGEIQVLVNVDIFSEGFDCPDVEFVQLARPTLSLAKYLQMVGRGLRVAKGKKNCVIVDNVGLYRVFGLPSQVWNWKATFEGRLKYSRRKETPKERDFFLMYGKQETMPVGQGSEMMMVMSHEELMQSLRYREFVDCNDDFAIVKLSDGKMTVVNRQGEQVIEPGNYYDMKFLRGNILSYRPRRKTVCYYDLLARFLIDEDIHAKDVPEVITINEWEFVVYNGLFRSRTYEDFALPYRPLQNDMLNRGYYLIFHNDFSVGSGCQVWYYYEGGDGLMRKDYTESKDVCFLRNDYEHVYWLCANLCGDGIVVMDSKEDYYLVDSNLKKTYIGCNNPKNKEEDLQYVMPRLGKKYYHETMSQKKKMEANEMLLLHEKSEAGHVELYQAGKKWGVKVDGKVIVPPLYHSISQPVGAYCAFEEIPRHWGVMTLKGKVIVDARYEKVEIHDNGIAMVTNITGKTQAINLK